MMDTLNMEIPENTAWGIGWRSIPDTSRHLYIVTEEPHDWRGGSEFDDVDKAITKFNKTIEKKGVAYLWKVYLDDNQIQTIGVFCFLKDHKRFERIM
jgi:hypothetical protein